MSQPLKILSLTFALTLILSTTGCITPSDKLSFPAQPTSRTANAWQYDVNQNGKIDFALIKNNNNTLDTIAYDDNEDGQYDRLYNLSDYQNSDVPHLIIMLDSIPFRTVHQRYLKGDFPIFPPPQKIIPPFPTMSEVIFGKLLHTAPTEGMINNYYNPHTKKRQNIIAKRFFGHQVPMDSRIDYQLSFLDTGQMFLDPQSWYKVELARAKKAIDQNPNNITIFYSVATAGLLSVLSEQGAHESLDGAYQLAMQLIYERQGAIKITILADHGHNYIKGKRFEIDDEITNAGFNITDSLNKPNDVVLEYDGLVNYLGLHTNKPEILANKIAHHKQIQLITYLQKNKVILQNHKGTASIHFKDGKYRYQIISADVLNYQPVINQLRSNNQLTPDQYASPDAWFNATLNHQFPDVPYRIWHAFHGLSLHPPKVMIALDNGYYYGPKSLEKFITMASTHGGIDAINSNTFLLSNTNRAKQPMRSKDVFPIIEPRYLHNFYDPKK